MSTGSKTRKSFPMKTSYSKVIGGLDQLIAPFGWSVNDGEVGLWDDFTLKVIEMFLQEDPEENGLLTPHVIWRVVNIPADRWAGKLSSVNDVRAIASVMLGTRKDFVGWQNTALISRLAARVSQAGAQTGFGALFCDESPFRMWFGRKAGKNPQLFDAEGMAVIHRIFGVPEPLDPAGELLPSKATAPVVCKPSGRKAGKAKAAKAPAAANPSGTLQMVDIADIQPSPDNHRKTFDQKSLQELADSIRQHGILQPLLLTAQVTDGALPGQIAPFRIIAGERRYRAAKAAGLTQVPAQIVEREGLQGSLAMLEENIRRVDLSPIERAQAIQSMISEHGLTQKEVGELIGCGQGQVSNELRLLQLPESLQKKVSSGVLAPTLIRVLLPYTDLQDVMVNVEHSIEQALKSDEPIEKTSLERWISKAILQCSRSMKFVTYWPHQKPDPKDRHFKTCTPENLKQLNVREFKCLNEWEGRTRTFNLALFDQLNAKPLAARKASHKKQEANRSKPMKWHQQGEAMWASPWAVRSELEQSFGLIVADALERSKDTVVHRICLAIALLSEGSTAEYFAGVPQHNPQCLRLTLEAFAGTPKEMERTMRKSVLSMLRDEYRLKAVEMIEIGKMLGTDLAACWKPTTALLELLTDAGRNAMAEAMGLTAYSDAAALIEAWPLGLVPEFLKEFFNDSSD